MKNAIFTAAIVLAASAAFAAEPATAPATTAPAAPAATTAAAAPAPTTETAPAKKGHKAHGKHKKGEAKM